MQKSLFWRLFFPIVVVVVVVCIAISWYVPILVKHQAEAAALEQAQKTVAQFKTIRAYYTQNVVAKVLGKGAWPVRSITKTTPMRSLCLPR